MKQQMSQWRKKINLVMTATITFSLFIQTVGLLIQAQETTETPAPTPPDPTVTDPTPTPESLTESNPTPQPLTIPTVAQEITPEPTVNVLPSSTIEFPSTTTTPVDKPTNIDPLTTPNPEPKTTDGLGPTPSMPTTNINDTVAAQANSGNNQSNDGGGSETTINTGGANAAGQQANVAGNEHVDVDASATAGANSGGNEANNNRSLITSISTGDAIAFINLVNLLNTQTIDSEIKVYFINLSNSSDVSANLNEIWKKMLTEGTPEATPINQEDINNVLQVSNGSAGLNTNVNVSANSGGNQITNSGGIAIIRAGNATALANIINLINTNLVSSKYLIGTINITGDYQGDLILPRLEMFMREDATADSVLINQAMGAVNMNNIVNSAANSGSNLADNTISSNITTGNAGSMTNTFVEAGINRFYEGSYFLMVNNLGNWSGQIWGWENPTAAAILTGYQNILYRNFNYQTSGSGQYQVVAVQNGPINSINTINVSAQSGNNQAHNNYQSDISTGSSLAMANLFNFANVNYYQNLRFFGLINILGNWKGNIIFAYPDVTMAMAVDQQDVKSGLAQLAVTVKNIGYDEANNVAVDLEIPEEITITGGLEGARVTGTSYRLGLGKIKIGEEKKLTVQMKIEPSHQQDQMTAWDKLTGKVWAAEENKTVEMLIRGKAVTSDPESNSTNNVSAVNLTYQYSETINPEKGNGKPEEKVDQPQQDQINGDLQIRAKNNVGEFVYPEDVVTFDLEVDNNGSTSIGEVKLYHIIVNNDHEVLTNTIINLEAIRAGVKGRITFGIPLPKGSAAGDYFSVTTIRGKLPDGKEIESNQSHTYFSIRQRQTTVFGQTGEVFDREGGARVLGLNSFMPQTALPVSAEVLWPYLVLFLCSAIWLRINLAKIIKILEAKQAVNIKPTTYALMGMMILLFAMSTQQLFKTKELRRLKFNFQQTQINIDKIMGNEGRHQN